MMPLVLTAMAALVALALLWRHWAKRQLPPASPARVVNRPPGNFRCVEVRYPSDACDAVKRIGEVRHLSGTAPEIPVAGCDAAKCSCRYVHHVDRRREDRRNPVAYRPPASSKGERRIKKDRRRTAKTALRPKTGR